MRKQQSGARSFSSYFSLASVPCEENLMRLPFSDELTANHKETIMHDGAITVILDSVSGFVVRNSCLVAKDISIATLDLRVDRLRPPLPSMDIYAKGDCYRVSQNIAFVRGWAYDQDIEDPIATSVATFMLGASKRKFSD